MSELLNDRDYSEAGERLLREFVEQVMQAPVVRMERLMRWRPAWFVDVERDGKIIHLHLRGEREGDVSIFPELKREADVISVLGEHGIPVPKIYGYCAMPRAILMEALAGSRNVAEAANDAERSTLCREYMSYVAAMHKLPVAPFVAKGVELPEGNEAITLAGLNAYMPLYQRTKRKPEPFIEFALGWLKRNVPQHRNKASFIQFDSGQFLFKDGKITGLYDFEFSMIGDPLVDLATMRMRDSVEPLGVDLREAYRYYEEFSGEKIDHAIIEFHSLLFAVISTMQFAGTVAAPDAGDPHSVYLEFDLALRQVVLHSLSALTGFTLTKPAPPTARTGDNAALIAKLTDTLKGIETSELGAAKLDSAARLIEWLTKSDQMGGEILARDVADVSALLGQRFDSWQQAEAALETFIRSAGPEFDEKLFTLFAAIEGRRLLVFGPTRIGNAAVNVHLPPTH
jgi:aminoglycoside phosphotransferase (APT) family kinase protein